MDVHNFKYIKQTAEAMILWSFSWLISILFVYKLAILLKLLARYSRDVREILYHLNLIQTIILKPTRTKPQKKYI
jgi:hypothetical protein